MSLLFLYLLLAIGVSFLCSILESVLMSTPFSFITMREEEGYRPAARFKRYKQDIDSSIAAILALNTIANTFGAAGVGRQAQLLFGSTWFGVISAVTTLLILIFAEIIPKSIGTGYYRHLMGFTVRALSVLQVLMYPFVLLIRLVIRMLPEGEDEAAVSREEVSAMANVGEEEGEIEAGENKVIQNILKLDNVSASDAMTPRVVCSVASEGMSLRDFYEDETFEHHSRIPVYAESPEYITGYILRSDALEALADDKFDLTLRDIRRDISFFEEDRSISDIWETLLKRREQIALIIDEYGCFQGILTLEDIIETIFGLEIMDESDEVSDMQKYARERWEKRQKRFKKIHLPQAGGEN